MKVVRDQVVPNLVEGGFLAHDADSGNFQGVQNWEQHQYLLEQNSKKKQQQSNDGQQNLEQLGQASSLINQESIAQQQLSNQE